MHRLFHECAAITGLLEIQVLGDILLIRRTGYELVVQHMCGCAVERVLDRIDIRLVASDYADVPIAAIGESLYRYYTGSKLESVDKFLIIHIPMHSFCTFHRLDFF